MSDTHSSINNSGRDRAEGKRGKEMGAKILDRNLAALSRTNPTLAELIRRTPPRTDVRFIETQEQDGERQGRSVLSAEIGTGTSARALASRRRPLDEARRQMEPIDPASAAVFVVGGFGLGYHVEALAKRLGRTGLVVVFEPDVALLRAVFEKIDHAQLLGGSAGPGKTSGMNVALLSDADDTGAMAQAIQGLEGIVALGVQLVEHAPSKARLTTTRLATPRSLAASALGSSNSSAPGTETGEQALARFHERFVTLVKGVKLTIVTTLVQIRTTLRNLTQNIDRYVLCPGIDELKNCCAGRPAVVVSAGPSLARNVDLLAAPGVRDRVVVIAVQTVLKTLLRKGIKPHFVTALDYSDLSSRFYEGLTRDDVEGVTLIVEPKVNPAVLQSFPGESVRCTGDAHLDKLLTPARGQALSPPRGTLTPGATVAHLAYYLARHLGCDPVALIGQDLAFTDGQYYAAGAAIHTVWSGELSAFQTLESLEWQRIMRMGGHLHRATDVLDRPVFTDEQMNSYRLQFERDFLADVRTSLRVYDCTEGGVRKQHTTPMSLAKFLERFAIEDAAPPVRIPQACSERDGQKRLARIAAHLQSVAEQSEQVRRISEEAAALLDEMLDVQDDERRVNTLIDQSAALGKRVAALEPAYGIVHLLAQSGALNRMKADRALQLADDLPGKERQKRQIERDRANVRSLSASAKELSRLLDHAIGSLPLEVGGRGEPKLTRELAREPAREPARSESGMESEAPGDSIDRPSDKDAAGGRRDTDHGKPTPCPLPLGGGSKPDPERRSRVVAIVAFDPLFTPLGVERRGVLSPRTPIVLRADHSAVGSSLAASSLAHASASWPSLLALTISRLRRCERLSAIRILTPDIAAARDALGSLLREHGAVSSVPIECVPIEREEMEIDRRCVAPARLLARDSWRSAPGSFTCYDEVFHPRAMLEAMGHGKPRGQDSFDAAIIVGPDWGLIDPVLCDRLIERHQSSPSEFRLVFTQSPPGLAGVVVHHTLVREVANLREGNTRALGGREESGRASASIGPLASVGGMLAYVPSAPATDLIAYPVCVSVDPLVRDAGARFVLDQTDDRGRGEGIAWDTLRLIAQRELATCATEPLAGIDALAIAQAANSMRHEREASDAPVGVTVTAAAVATASPTSNAMSRARSSTERSRTAGMSEPPAHLIVPVARVLDDESGEVEYADAAAVCEVIRKALVRRRDTAITLAGSRCASGVADADVWYIGGQLDWRADPINHPGLLHILRRARLHPESGFFGAMSIHLRTGLLTTPERVEELLAEIVDGPGASDVKTAGAFVGGVDVLSVDMPGESAAVYRAITGLDGYGQARANLERVLHRRRAFERRAWLARPLLCLRLVRCDQSYAEIETFYNRWMSRADWAVLDPLPEPSESSMACANTRRVIEASPRIRALPLPDAAQRRLARTERVFVPTEPGYWPSDLVPARPTAWPTIRVGGGAAAGGALAMANVQIISAP